MVTRANGLTIRWTGGDPTQLVHISGISNYLGGVVAGLLSKTKTVGAVVGGDSPGLNQFYWAYKQGVMDACPDWK